MSRATRWTGTAQNQVLLGIGILLLAGGVAWLVLGSGFGGITLLLGGLLMVVFHRIRVEIDAGGVRVRWGPLGVPVNRIALNDIEAAESVAIRPLHAGGWGYRGSRALFRQATAMVRGGPAIKLQLAKRRIFVITVDDAPTGTTVLQNLLEER